MLTEQPMNIDLLTLPEIREIYRKRVKHDFPANEVKSLAMIEKAFRDGRYRCYGVRADDDLLAYAFFVLAEDVYLLDYFAVRQDLTELAESRISEATAARAAFELIGTRFDCQR